MTDYDFIIVGAGSAGCVLANRLSEDGLYRVLLLEAGGKDWSPIIHIPLLAGVAYFDKSLNWGYDTEPEKGLGNRKLHWPRGKVVGGSSSINGMMYVRGQPQDYDSWQELGLDGWGYSNVLPYFKRSENHLENKNSPFHGTTGPWKIKRSVSDNPLYAAFFDSCYQAGFKETDDFNGESQEGFQWHDFNISNGRRQSTAVAFLRSALKRRNLHIEKRAHVKRIIFKGKKAVGVELDQFDNERLFYANKEVILCCGSVNTPSLLMHSGIGDAKKLREMNINVVNNLPGVGSNLQDHAGVYIQYESLKPITMYKWFRPDRAVGMMLQAIFLRSGVATRLPLEGGLFAKTNKNLYRPDVQISMVPGLSLATTQKGQGRHGFLIHVYQLRPESRGKIELRSLNPYDKPLIKPGYFSKEPDLQVTREGVKIVNKIFSQDAFVPYLGKPISPKKQDLSDQEIENWIRSAAETVFHPTSTCKMSASHDPMGVVDNSLNVRGVESLRIADASIMPNIISGNTQAPTVMIAEKASDIILGKEPL
tara:strand:- start:1675 stop:3279 length:1605 start_codon:yes stop_codon:yes gene_type:complete